MILKQPRYLMTSAIIAAGLGLCAGQALANEISGTLNGEPHEWHVLSEGDMSTASFSEFMPGMINVTVQGHRNDRYETQGTLSIDFMVMQGQPGDASVSYFHESGLTPHYGTEEDVPIEIDTLEIDGDSGRARGRVVTSLAYLESMQAAYDHDNAMEVDVSFDVVLTNDD
ncbi:MAG: hypothetical protein LC652_06485 [Halomonas sp.]|nr:hypothetical protein [Halomonas sp.]